MSHLTPTLRNDSIKTPFIKALMINFLPQPPFSASYRSFHKSLRPSSVGTNRFLRTGGGPNAKLYKMARDGFVPPVSNFIDQLIPIDCRLT